MSTFAAPQFFFEHQIHPRLFHEGNHHDSVAVTTGLRHDTRDMFRADMGFSNEGVNIAVGFGLPF